MDEISQFWNKQVASLNREASDEFYRRKAREHREILSDHDARAGILDLGCGAGELLEHLMPLAKVAAGLDYSETMLNSARNRCGHAMEFILGDVFAYLPATRYPVWTTTGALNQYLDANELSAVLDTFHTNENVTSFYLFDCIDPLRYHLLLHGISYRPEHTGTSNALRFIKSCVRRCQIALGLILGSYGRQVRYLGSPGMGYGQRPSFWLRACAAKGLSVEIVSSRYYEYRYHVILRKGLT